MSSIQSSQPFQPQIQMSRIQSPPPVPPVVNPPVVPEVQVKPERVTGSTNPPPLSPPTVNEAQTTAKKAVTEFGNLSDWDQAPAISPHWVADFSDVPAAQGLTLTSPQPKLQQASKLLAMADQLVSKHAEEPKALLDAVSDDPRLQGQLEQATSTLGNIKSAMGKANFWTSKLPMIGFLSNAHKAVQKHSQSTAARHGAELAASEGNSLGALLMESLALEKRHKAAGKAVAASVGAVLASVDAGIGVGSAVASAVMPAVPLDALMSSGGDKAGDYAAQTGIGSAVNFVTGKGATKGIKVAVTHADDQRRGVEPSEINLGSRSPGLLDKVKGLFSSPTSYDKLIDEDELASSQSHHLGEEHVTRALLEYLAAPALSEAELKSQGVHPDHEAARLAIKQLLGSPADEDLRPTSSARTLTPEDQQIKDQLKTGGLSRWMQGASGYERLTDAVEDGEVNYLRLALVLDKRIQ